MPVEKEKFYIADLAKEMGVEPATARIALRKKGVKKAGREYTWDTRTQVKELAAKLRSSEKTEKKADTKKAVKKTTKVKEKEAA